MLKSALCMDLVLASVYCRCKILFYTSLCVDMFLNRHFLILEQALFKDLFSSSRASPAALRACVDISLHRHYSRTRAALSTK